MGKKNKLAQQVRRQARALVEEQFSIINEVIKPKPKYFPLWLWRKCARLFVDVDLLRDYMQQGVEPKVVRDARVKK